jgi:hypothetical protein
MSRFFDDIISRKAVPWPELQELLEKSTVILADNVAEYLYSGTDQDYWSLETDFPNLAPLFELFFIEWRDPQYVVTRERGRQQFPVRARNGALFISAESSAIASGEAAQDYRWLQNIWIWTESRREINCLGSMTIKIGSDGRAVRFSDKGYFMATLNPGLKTPASAELLLSVTQPALLTVCFLHCKNVRMESHTPPAPLAKKHRLRYGRPPVVYKTLIIEPLKRVLSNEGNADVIGLKKALHICRGHFKDYKERGLFGKIHGVFWWSDHLAGTLRSGLVKKDYNVRLLKPEDQ